MRRHHFHHFWLILAAYGVWFAIFSGVEEIMAGKYWKAILGLIFGITVYFIIAFDSPTPPR